MDVPFKVLDMIAELELFLLLKSGVVHYIMELIGTFFTEFVVGNGILNGFFNLLIVQGTVEINC